MTDRPWNRYIGQQNVEAYASELAWKRAGFKDYAALRQAVRDLPLEKKVEMLVDLSIHRLAANLFEEKQEFLLSLGKKTWVDGDELYEHAKATFTAPEWRIDRHNFQPVAVVINSANCVDLNIVNNPYLEDVKKKRGKKENND